MPRVPPVTNATRAMLKSLLFAFPDASWRDACCVASNYASRLTNIKNKTPGEIAGRFFLWFRAVQLRRSIVVAIAAAFLVACNAHRNSHAASDAERGETLLGIALLHLVQQRHQDARARRTDRVADRDRTAIDVHLRGIPAEVLVDSAGLRGKGF